MEITPKSLVEELPNTECWQLLRQASFGRLAVLRDGRPDIFPVNQAVDRGSLLFRTDAGTKLLGDEHRSSAGGSRGGGGIALLLLLLLLPGRLRPSCRRGRLRARAPLLCGSGEAEKGGEEEGAS